MNNPLKRVTCWWFGCEPDMEAIEHSYHYECVPCSRCGAPDVSYADQVGDTRHHRAKEWARWWLWRRWLPAKCHDCGNRFGNHDQCDDVPF